MEDAFGSSESCSSSGCESGWTLYLEHSMYHHPSHSFQNHNNDFSCKQIYQDYDDDDEDMSMVSDASSGPPHFQQQQECGFDKINPTNGRFRQKLPEQPNSHTKLQDLPSFLDDTASSPFFNFSNNNLTVSSNKASMEENEIIDYSQGYSTTYFQGKSAFQDQFGLFHPSLSATKLQQNQWFEEKSWA